MLQRTITRDGRITCHEGVEIGKDHRSAIRGIAHKAVAFGIEGLWGQILLLVDKLFFGAFRCAGRSLCRGLTRRSRLAGAAKAGHSFGGCCRRSGRSGLVAGDAVTGRLVVIDIFAKSKAGVEIDHIVKTCLTQEIRQCNIEFTGTEVAGNDDVADITALQQDNIAAAAALKSITETAHRQVSLLSKGFTG